MPKEPEFESGHVPQPKRPVFDDERARHIRWLMVAIDESRRKIHAAATPEEFLAQACKTALDLGFDSALLEINWSPDGHRRQHVSGKYATDLPSAIEECRDLSSTASTSGAGCAAALNAELSLPDLTCGCRLERLGFRRAVTIPLSSGEEVFGRALLLGMRPEPFDERQVLAFYWLARDIALAARNLTDRERLKRSESTYRKLLEAIGQGIATLDDSGRILSCSMTLADTLALPQSEITGTHILEHVAPHDRGILESALANRNHEVRTIEELQLLRGDAAIAHADFTIRSLGNEALDNADVMLLCRDITDLTHTRQSFKRLSEVYQSILTNIPSGIIAFGSDGMITMFNEAAQKIFKVTNRERSSFYNRDIRGFEFVRRHAIVPLVERVMEGREISHTVHDHELDTGHRISVSFTAVPVRDLQNEPDGGFVIISDITQELKACEDRRRSEEMLQVVADTLPAQLAYIDRYLTFKFANRAFRDFGRDPSELINHSVSELTEPMNDDRLVPELRTALAGNRRRGMLEWRDENGAQSFFEHLIEPHVGADGSVDGAVLLLEDKTESRRLDEDMRRAKKMFESLVENLPLGVAIVQEGRFQYVNPGLGEILGRSRDEVLNLAPDQWLKDPRGQLATWLREPPQEEEATLQISEWALHKSAGELELDVVRTRIPFRKESARMFIIRDVTNERRLREDLIKAEKMRALGTLAGGIAHDFNNLLTGISAHVWHLRALLCDQHLGTEEADGIERLGQRGAQLINKLLALGQRQMMVPVPIDLNHHLREFVAVARRLIEATVIMSVELAPDLPAIKVDPVLLDRVLLNLAINARDAMPDGGRLHLQTRSLPPLEEGERPRVELRVRDTGPGIPDALRERIFDPFFSTKEIGQGAGLGLAVVYGIIEQHGGTIELEGHPHEGTTFTIVFPSTNTHPAGPPEGGSGDDPPKIRSLTVLVAEDDADLRLLTRRDLERTGHKVLMARDGVEAVELFLLHRDEIDALFLDIVMPNKGGLDALREISKHSPGIPAILVSGYSPEVVGGALDEFEGVLFLEKPYSHKKLNRTLARLLKH